MVKILGRSEQPLHKRLSQGFGYFALILLTCLYSFLAQVQAVAASSEQLEAITDTKRLSDVEKLDNQASDSHTKPLLAPNIDLKKAASFQEEQNSTSGFSNQEYFLEPSLHGPPHPKTIKLFFKKEDTLLQDSAWPQRKAKSIDEEKYAPYTGKLPRHQTDAFMILGKKILPGTSTRLGWSPKIAIAGLATPVPVLVINGAHRGQTLCLTAAIHGDELNGIEVIRRVMYEIDPKKLKGRIVGIPIVNLQGFQRNSRYMADRRDLNRYFPGDEKGSIASRIAFSLFNKVIRHCDSLIDLHTGSQRRTNLPQIRADMRKDFIVSFTENFDDIVVVHSSGKNGMLRNAAAAIGIPAVTLEIGESNRLQTEHVESGVKRINGLLDRLHMYERIFIWGVPEPVYYRSSWVRADSGGILFSHVELGSHVEEGEMLGEVINPITNGVRSIRAPFSGRVIGMAVDQVVMPGFASYHLGILASESEISDDAQNQTESQEVNNEDSDP